MPVTLVKLATYSDALGNRVDYDGIDDVAVRIRFQGGNNSLLVHAGAKIGHLQINFDCNNAKCEIKKTSGSFGSLQLLIRLGEDCEVTIGDGLTCNGNVFISTAEGAKVTIGNDCMFAMGVTIRADDAHPIFDVTSGERVNPSRDIIIGDHIWMCQGVTVLGGSKLGEGSVLGAGSVLKSEIPNNCIAAGVPAKVTRKNIAWERPHLTFSKPYYKMHADSITKSKYWKKTLDTIDS